MSFRKMLKNTCEIHTPSAPTESSAVDDWNNPVEGDPAPVVQTDVPCFVYTRAGTEYSLADRVLVRDDVLFDFMPTVSIANNSTIVFDGNVYQVEQIATVGGGHHKTARAVQQRIG